MSDRLEDDVMDDLMAEPEGRGPHAMEPLDEADEADAASEFDELDDSFDEGEEAFEGETSMDAFEDAVSDALEAEDFDEFWGKIGGFLKKVGRGVGSVARVVAPIASAIPLPQAQLIGRIAGTVGDVLADEGDEFDALEELADEGEDEATVRAAAPVIAGLAIRSGLKHHAARIQPVARRQLVHAVTQATKQISRAHGPRAVVALPGIVHHARKIAVRRGLPASALPQLVRRIAKRAAQSPQLVRKLHRQAAHLRTGAPRHYRGVRGAGGGWEPRGAWRGGYAQGGYAPGGYATGGRVARGYGGGYPSGYAQGGYAPGGYTQGGARGAVCAGCGRRRSWRLHGPVQITIQSL